MGMMNNAWYRVIPEVVQRREDGEWEILFRHPAEPGRGIKGGCNRAASCSLRMQSKQAIRYKKQFTREEIEKHDGGKSCWLVVDGKVYDVASVWDWYPGGAAAVLGHAGKVHQDTTDEFASIHDDYAYQKLGGKSLLKLRIK